MSEQEKTVKESLHDIGLGTNSIANRLVSVGIVGVFVILFVGGCWAMYNLLREEMNLNRDAAKMFVMDLKMERERQDLKWLNTRERSDMKHVEMMGAIKVTQAEIKEMQRSIVDSQKSFDRAVSAMEGAVKVLSKKLE